MRNYLKSTFIVICLIFGINSIIGQSLDENDQQLNLKIDAYLNNSVTSGYSGSILVAKEGKIILSKGYGWADRKYKIPNKSTTIFNIGSVSKQFTAAAILKLEEQGKLKVEDLITKYFDNIPEDKKTISIHQLLTHTSGVSPGTGGFRYNEASKTTFLKEFFESKLVSEPGMEHRYANANYILLAAIIESVSGKDFESFLHEYFWAPLKMNHTGYKSISFNSEQIAHGYYFELNDGKWADWGITQENLPSNENHWYSIGKGDIYSTVEDLYTWHLALKNNKVLKLETLKKIETAHVAENSENTSFYGYGWAIYNSKKNTKIVSHNGSNGIYFSDILRFVEDDITIITLSNIILNQKSESVAWDISNMVLDSNYQIEPMPKNTYELVFNYIHSNSPSKSDQLPNYIENHTGNKFSDKAVLNRIGFKLVSNETDVKWGISLLKLNVTLFPNDGNLWDSLGEAYYSINDKKNAINSFEQALILKTDSNCHWCENARNRLKELKP